MKSVWPIKNIGELCDLNTGGTPSRSKKEYFDNGTIPWLVSGDVHKGEVLDCEGRITEKGLENSNARYLPINSILIALNGQGKTKGTVAMLRMKATCNQSVVSISPKNVEELLPEYLYINLKGRYKEIRKLTGDSGNDRRGLNMPLLRQIKIPIAPIEVQRRIVEVLENAFSKIERLQTIAKRNIENDNEIIAKVINKTFDEPKVHWDKMSLDQVCGIKSMLVDPREEQYLDCAHIGAGNIISNSTELVNVKTARDEGLRSSKFPFDTSMVLYSKIRPYLMKVATPDFEGICSADIYPLSPYEELLGKDFLFYTLLSKNFTDYAISGSGRAGMPKVNRTHLFQYEFNIPTLDEQKILVKKWNALRLATSERKSVMLAKLKALSELKQSILARAFNGELIDAFSATPMRHSSAYYVANDNYIYHGGAIAYADSYFRTNAPDTFHGRTIFEKVAQAAETIAGIELGRQAVQGMRGPTDDKQRETVEAMALENEYFSFESTGGKGMKLQRGRNFNELRLSFEQKFQTQIPAFDKFLRLIAPMPTRDVEVLSTVHTAWNNYLIEKQEPTDEQIVHAACEGWHEEKTKIPRHKFFTAIETLRKQGLVPTGQGKYIGKIAGKSFDF